MDGKLIVVSGYSGAGKGTVLKEVFRRMPQCVYSVSVTTRQPREGEKDGRDYFFRTPEQFEEMVERDAFLEFARYTSSSYGTPKAWVKENVKAGKIVVLEIEVQGAMQIREKYPQVPLVFITAPDFTELERRLRQRGTETEERIQMRMEAARREQEYVCRYDKVIVNDQVERCADQLERFFIQAPALDADTF